MSSALGSTPGIIVGVGVGAAASAALEPAIEIPKQEAWAKNPNRLLDPATVARLVAQGGITLPAAKADALREGYGPDKVESLVYLSQTVPGFAEALALWRRNPASFEALWRHALVKNGIDARYLDYLDQLKDDRLSPPVVALAIVRGILADPGFLPVGPPSTEGKVRAFPTSALDALKEAEAFGFDRERLFVQTAISGRPMGPESAAAAVFKGILDRVDFDRAISEGDIRNEWADAIFEDSRPIPHPIDYVQARLRGWRTTAEMHAGAHRSGMRDADTDLLFLIHGRPPSVRQVFIGLRRGGVYDGPTTAIEPPVLKAMQESDIRPEWFNILDAQKESLPSPFVLRALTQAHDLTEDEAHELLLHIGWPVALAAKIAARWAGGTAAKGDPHVTKAQNQLWTTTHRSYVADESDTTAATAALTALGVAPAAIPDVLALWDYEKALIRKQLTPAQVKKAFRGAILNRDTGATWTRDDALAALLERGYSANAANEFLDL